MKVLLSIILIMSLSGMLSACEEGHSFSSRYRNGVPVKQAKQLPKDKPKTNPRKYARTSSGKDKYITVRKGDTIYALSRRHDVTVRGIIKANDLKPPYLLYPGQRLKGAVTAIHVVKKGDTVYSLSRKYNVDMRNFSRLNNLNQPFALAIGQTLTVPSYNRKKAVALPLPPSQSSKGFMWPVRGPLLSSYGPKAKGYHNDGINIAAKSGSTVMAAQSGVIVHAGRKIKGFGNLILVRHAQGWITAYAHNSAILVQKGQKVKRGQAIARIGTSGGVSRPQLHFEMRKGSRAVNPIRYLKS